MSLVPKLDLNSIQLSTNGTLLTPNSARSPRVKKLIQDNQFRTHSIHPKKLKYVLRRSKSTTQVRKFDRNISKELKRQRSVSLVDQLKFLLLDQK